MRDREHATTKPEDTSRVLILGDSFMEALQVAFEDSFPSQLESGLRGKLGRKVEVINFAVSGWGQDDQLAYLKKYGLGYEPDLILVAMTLHNDILDNLKERFHTLAGGKLADRPAARMSDSEFRILQLKGFLASHSHVWQLLRKAKNLREIRVVAADLDKHVAQLVEGGEVPMQLGRGWDLTFELLKSIRDAGKRVGAETVVMVIPLNLQLQQGAQDAPRTVAGTSSSERAIDKPQRAISEFGRNAGIDIIDLLPFFRYETLGRRTSLHLQEGHWNVTGHRVAAGVVASEIVNRRLLEAGPMAGREATGGPRRN
jgi:hypothetical protein